MLCGGYTYQELQITRAKVYWSPFNHSNSLIAVRGVWITAVYETT